MNDQRSAFRTVLLAAVLVKVFYCLTLHQPTTDNFSKSDKEIEYDRGIIEDDNQSALNSNISHTSGIDANISYLLDSLVKNYDKRIRPNYGGPPVEVLITAHVTTISGVSEVSMDYTLDLYLRQFWRDPRLSFSSMQETSLTIGIDMVRTIWTPDTFFPNEKKSFFHEATSHNSFLRIDSEGNVLRSVRLTVTANCPMNLQTFPLDVQVCALEIESYGYSTKDIIYHWRFDKGAVTIDETVHLAHFRVGEHYHEERTISLSTGNYSRLSTYFTFERNIGFYLIQIYLPSSLIVVISWVSFWLSRDATQARVAIGVTTVLTMTTLMTSTNSSMPKVSYVKSIDIYLGTCFFIVFASLLEYAAVGYLMKRRRMKSSATDGTSGTNIALKKIVSKTVDAVQPLSATMLPFYGSIDRRLEPVGSQSDSDCECPGGPHVLSPSPPVFVRSSSNRHIPPIRALIPTSDRQRPLNHLSRHRQQSLPHGSASALQQQQQHHSPTPLVRMDSLGSHSGLPLIEATAHYTPPTAIRMEAEEATKSPNGRRRTRCFVRPSAIDKWSRVLFPVIFVLFHCVYWTVYMSMV